MKKKAAISAEDVGRELIDTIDHGPSVTIVNRERGISEALKRIALHPDENKVTGSLVKAIANGTFDKVSDSIHKDYASL